MAHTKGKKLIYLASPYSHDDPAVRQYRYDEVCREAAKLIACGEQVFSPIAHSHGIASYGLPGDYEYWESYDRWFIERCDVVEVLMLDGWSTSEGVRAEIRLAVELGKSIAYREVR